MLFNQTRVNGGPSFIIQGELAPSKTSNKSASNVSDGTKTNKHKSSKEKGGQKVITYVNAQFIQIYVDMINFRFEKLLYDKQYRGMSQDVPKTIEMIRSILEMKTLKSLMRTYMQRLPSFFGFEKCFVMFFDKEVSSLYSLTFAEEFQRE